MLTAAASTTRLGVTACAAEMTASLAAASTVMVVPSGKTPSAAETETETPLPAVPPAVKAGIAGAAGVSVEVGASSVLSLPEIGSCFAGASVGAGSSSFSAEAVGASVAAGVSVAAGASSRFSSSEDDTASCVFSVSAITVPGASFAVSSADGAPSVFAAPAASAVFSAPAGFASAEPSVSSVSSCALSAIAFSALGASSLAAAAVTAFPKTAETSCVRSRFYSCNLRPYSQKSDYYSTTPSTIQEDWCTKKRLASQALFGSIVEVLSNHGSEKARIMVHISCTTSAGAPFLRLR